MSNPHAALLIFAAVWQKHAVRTTDSTAARVVGYGVLATAAAETLGFGWKGSLGNYLGDEAGMFDEHGMLVYYVLTDFGAYLPWVGVLISAWAVVWMAFVEKHVSRILGAVTAVIALGATVAMLAMGVPGIPGTAAPLWLVIFGIWLAVGRKSITSTVAEAL